MRWPECEQRRTNVVKTQSAPKAHFMFLSQSAIRASLRCLERNLDLYFYYCHCLVTHVDDIFKSDPKLRPKKKGRPRGFFRGRLRRAKIPNRLIELLFHMREFKLILSTWSTWLRIYDFHMSDYIKNCGNDTKLTKPYNIRRLILVWNEWAALL